MPRIEGSFHTIEGLLEVLGNERRDKGIMCQAVAINGDAWNMFATFTPAMEGNDMSLLQLHHEDLKFLHQKFNCDQLAEYLEKLEYQMFREKQYGERSSANAKRCELMDRLQRCIAEILPELKSLETQTNPSNSTQ